MVYNTDAARDQFVLNLYVTNPGPYKVVVTAEDFLGGTDTIEHTIMKTNVNLPNVRFSSSGIMQGTGSQYIVYPNTMYVTFYELYFLCHKGNILQFNRLFYIDTKLIIYTASCVQLHTDIYNCCYTFCDTKPGVLLNVDT